MQKATVWAALAGVATMIVLIAARGFFWHHALVVGAAVTALVLAARNAFLRLRRFGG